MVSLGPEALKLGGRESESQFDSRFQSFYSMVLEVQVISQKGATSRVKTLKLGTVSLSSQSPAYLSKCSPPYFDLKSSSFPSKVPTPPLCQETFCLSRFPVPPFRHPDPQQQPQASTRPRPEGDFRPCRSPVSRAATVPLGDF